LQPDEEESGLGFDVETQVNNDNEEQLIGQGQLEVEVNDFEQPYDDFEVYHETNVVNVNLKLIQNPYQEPPSPIIPLITQEDLDLLHQQVQTISAEREVANTIGLQAQQDLVNLRLNFHEVVAEKNALLMEQGCLREANSHKHTQLDQLQTQLNNAITFQNETTTSLSEAKSSLEKTTTIVQTISAERDDAATLVQHSQNELANLRRNFDAVVSEKNALTTNQTSLNQSINALK
jgi:hypothetical protein